MTITLKHRRLGMLQPSGAQAILVLGLGPLALACGSAPTETIEKAQAATVFGADNRTSLTEAVFDANPALKSVGFVYHGGICTGTLISAFHVLTTAHCFAVAQSPTPAIPVPAADTVPSDIRFLPKFIYDPADPGSATKASVYGARITMGTGIGNGSGCFGTVCNDYIAGSDWAVITLNTATYTPGSNTPAGCSGAACTYKAGYSTLAGYTPMQITYPSLGLPTPITVTSVGYSGDWFNATNKGSMHAGCQASAEELPTYPGVLKTDCDFTGGASGGPVYQTISGTRYITALNGGEGPATYNRIVSSASFVWAPINTGGIAAVKDSAGATWVFGSDRDWYLKVSARKQLSAGGVFNAWWDFRAGATPPQLPDRITATRLASADGSRMWLFMTSRDNGQVWSRWETSLGAWSDWTSFFPGASQSLNAQDVAVTSNGEASASGAAVVQVYILGSGSIATTRKTSTWNGSWSSWQTLTKPFATNQPTIAAVVTEAFQVVSTGGRDSGTNDSIATAWTTTAAGDTWSSWQKETAPEAGNVVDVEYGHAPNGALDMFVIMAPSGLGSPTRNIWRRTKVSAVAGSAWGSWSQAWSSTTSTGLRGAYRLTVAPPESGDTAANPRVKVASDWGIVERDVVGGTSIWRSANSPRL